MEQMTGIMVSSQRLNIEQVVAHVGIGGTLGPPLHIASLMGNIELIKWLLENRKAELYDSDSELADIVRKWSFMIQNSFMLQRNQTDHPIEIIACEYTRIEI
jgi:ankyrin repeat protein